MVRALALRNSLPAFLLSAAVAGGCLAAPVQAAVSADLTARIASLEAQIAALQAQVSGAAPSFDRTLAPGASGPQVSALQGALKELGYFTYPSITGFFGSATYAAVVAYQKANGLEPVGVLGPRTRALLNARVSYAPAPSSSAPATPSSPSSSTLPTVNGIPITPGKNIVINPGHHGAGDITPPVLSLIAVGTTTASTTRIVWSTDEAADAQIEYGLTSSYTASSTLDATLAITHTVVLAGLAPNVMYHYRIRSADAKGNIAYSSDATFSTNALPSISGTPSSTGTLGTAYSYSPTLSGGLAPYTVSVISGSLPSGLSLNAATGAISGTPTTEETHGGIALRIVDANGDQSDTSTFTITVGTVQSTQWRILALWTNDAPNDGNGYFAPAEIQFRSHVGDSTQPTSGTPSGSAIVESGSTVDKAFDGNSSTYFATSIANGGIAQYTFNSAVQVDEVLFQARTSFQAQAPRTFDVQYYDGSSWQTRKHIAGLTWSSGQSRVFDLDTDASLADETGGHRYWAIKETGNNFQGGAQAWQEDLKLMQSGTNIAPQFGLFTGSNINSERYAFDGADDGNIFAFNAIGSYVVVDFGRKRVVDQVGVTARTSPFNVQALKQFDIYAGDTSTDIATMTLIKSVNDTNGTPASHTVTYYSIP